MLHFPASRRSRTSTYHRLLSLAPAIRCRRTSIRRHARRLIPLVPACPFRHSLSRVCAAMPVRRRVRVVGFHPSPARIACMSPPRAFRVKLPAKPTSRYIHLRLPTHTHSECVAVRPHVPPSTQARAPPRGHPIVHRRRFLPTCPTLLQASRAPRSRTLHPSRRRAYAPSWHSSAYGPWRLCT